MQTLPTSFTEVLKSQTSPMHEKLDQLPSLSRLMTPDLSESIYTDILQKMHRCFDLVESAARNAGGDEVFQEYFYQSRIDDLSSDLEKMANKTEIIEADI